MSWELKMFWVFKSIQQLDLLEIFKARPREPKRSCSMVPPNYQGHGVVFFGSVR